MSLGVASLELGGKPWVSDWADVTPARTREAQGGCGPGEWERGRMWCQGWVLVTPYPLFPRLFLSVFGFPRTHLSYALNFDLCLFTPLSPYLTCSSALLPNVGLYLVVMRCAHTPNSP